MVAEHGSSLVAVLQKKPTQSPREFIGHAFYAQELTRTGRAFYFEIVAVIMMKLLQGLDNKVVQRHPDRTSPVRVAAEEPGIRFGRLIRNRKLGSVRPKLVWVVQVMPRNRADAEVGKELGLVQHSSEQALHPMAAQQGQQMALPHSRLIPPRDQLGEVGPVIEKPLQPACKC